MGTILAILVLFGVIAVVGLTIEYMRRRGLETWAQEMGGMFVPGPFLAGVSVPEAAPFDRAFEEVTYHDVSRFQRPEATYTVALMHLTYRDNHGTVKTHNCVVCFITLPQGAWPAVTVHHRTLLPELVASIVGLPDRAAPVEIPHALPEFLGQFEARPLSGADRPDAVAMARFLPPAIQKELLGCRELITDIRALGNVVRIQAVRQSPRRPHREVLALALRLAAVWAADSGESAK